MTDNEYKYWAFLSHSPQDNREKRPDTQEVSNVCWGDWLHEALKTFAIPADFVGQINGRGELIPERIDRIFRDPQERPEEANLSAGVREALEHSRCLVVICSPRATNSLQVNEEVRYFKQLGRGRNIFPIVVAGEPDASDGNRPGIAPEDECFVPAMRHPVQPDGTLDTARRAGRYVFVDARHGIEKREILATDDRNAEADLEMARIHLIALVIGVGFNELWRREQKRHFFDFAEARQQTREARNQVEEAQRQIREVQNKALEAQGLPRDIHSQIQEAQSQALEAQKQARETQEQLQEFQNKVRDTQIQLEEARNRVLAAESRVLEMQNQAQNTQSQLAETGNQAQEAHNKFLEAQSQVQEFQKQARDAQTELEEARNQVEEARRQTGEAQNKALEIQTLPGDVQGQFQEVQNLASEAQKQAREAQNQIQEFQNKVRDTQIQLEEAHNRALAAESRVLEMQNQAQNIQSEMAEGRNQAQDANNQFLEAQSQALEFQNQTREAQKQLEEFQNKVRDTHAQLEEAGNRTLAAESKVLEAQNQAQSAQSQLIETRNQAQDVHNKFLETQSRVQEFQNQAREAQSQLEEARNQVREAQNQVQEMENHTRDAQSQIKAARNQVEEMQRKSRNARRLTKVFALLAVLGLLAVGTAANIALRQRRVASQALAKAAAEEAGKFDPAPGGVDGEQIRQALRNIGGAEQDENRQGSLDELAAWVPREEIPDTLKASSVILNDQQRSHFQKWLLIRLGWADPVAAMTNASAIEGKIVNDEGLSDSGIYFQLAVLDNWMRTNLQGAFNWVCGLPDVDSRERALEKIIPALAADNAQSTLVRLNDLKPAPDERIYKLLFERWAANDPVQAIQQRQQIPDHDAGEDILCAIMTAWVNQQPDAALDWVKSQPDSESKTTALETCIGELAKKDVPRALALAESLPEGTGRNMVIVGLFNDWAVRDPKAATNWVESADSRPEIMQPRKAAWTTLLLDSDFGSPR